MNDRLGVFGKGIQTTGNPIIETGADGEDQVRFTHGHVGPVGAMHAQHAHREWVGFRKRPQAQKRSGYWGVQQLCKLAELRGGI